MSKYVYSKKYNKIFLTERFKKTDGWYKEIYIPTFGRSLDDIDFEIKDGIEFDRFEDLIEVGDLLCIKHEPLTNSPGLMVDYYAEPEISYEYRGYSKWMSKSYPGYVEIWKRIDNIFKRICHKEKGQWVIG